MKTPRLCLLLASLFFAATAPGQEYTKSGPALDRPSLERIALPEVRELLDRLLVVDRVEAIVSKRSRVVEVFDPASPLMESDEYKAQFSSHVAISGERFALKFRPDSVVEYAREDCYWDGRQYAVHHVSSGGLVLYPPGKYLRPMALDYLSHVLNLGHRPLATGASYFTKKAKVKVGKGKTDQGVRLLIEESQKVSLEADFISWRDRLILREMSARTPGGKLLEYFRNEFAPADGQSLVPPALVRAVRYAAVMDPMTKKPRNNLDVFEVTILSSEGPQGDVFTPVTAAVTLVNDRRFDPAIEYYSKGAILPAETVEGFIKDPARKRQYEASILNDKAN